MGKVLLCFTTNKIHYSCYGTFYVEQIKNLETSYCGTTEQIRDFRSVETNSIHIEQAIDLAREQRYMKSAKTAGN